jgi:hypothetical protein
MLMRHTFSLIKQINQLLLLYKDTHSKYERFLNLKIRIQNATKRLYVSSKDPVALSHEEKVVNLNNLKNTYVNSEDSYRLRTILKKIKSACFS